MAWLWEIVERDHELQNPTSREKILSDFADAARARVAAAGLESLVDILTADAAHLPLEPGHPGRRALPRRELRLGNDCRRGHGTRPLGSARRLRRDRRAVARFAQAGLAMTGVIAASEDDWDRYESMHWAIEEWLAENPSHPDAEDMRRQHRPLPQRILRLQAGVAGWATFVGRRP